MQNIPNIHEQVFVSAILSETNGKTSSILDSFSGWLVGGFGAATVLLVSQFESISKHVDSNAIHGILLLFFWSLGAAIIEKYLAAGVASHSQSSATGREMGEKAAAASIPLDLEIIFKETEKSLLPPLRWFASRSFTKLKEGDVLSGVRMITLVTQIQGVLVLIQGLLVMAAIYKVALYFHA